MKLLTTSSVDIVQECRVMFDAKSVSKSIFKCRRNVLPVVVFKYLRWQIYAVVFGGYTRVYAVYQPPGFLTAYTHLSDHK